MLLRKKKIMQNAPDNADAVASDTPVSTAATLEGERIVAEIVDDIVTGNTAELARDVTECASACIDGKATIHINFHKIFWSIVSAAIAAMLAAVIVILKSKA